MHDEFDSQHDSYERTDDTVVNPCENEPLRQIVARRVSRRGLVLGSLASGALGVLGSGSSLWLPVAHAGRADFEEVRHGADETHHVAAKHSLQVLIRWGDPVMPTAPPFDPMHQDPSAQSLQFGFNNDYVGYVALDGPNENASRHGLLCVNHEYTNARMMFPKSMLVNPAGLEHRVGVEMAAHGGSVLEIERRDTREWRVVQDKRFNRRITANTLMRISGPAAGHARLRTADDRSARRVIGTINNCAGGVTPWGTWLMAEENFHGYFRGSALDLDEANNHRRYGVPGTWFDWGLVHPRFNVEHSPNEPNRFGWVVEVDPMNPRSVPVKRTALGRFKHEGAETIVNGDGRLVVYMGDDQAFEYLYRFVSRRAVSATRRADNQDLLDDGELSVARFDDDGTLQWRVLRHGEGPLVAENGFHSQADVLIETRRAADLLGATPLDRPEDVQPDPVRHRVYVLLTGNRARNEAQRDAVNPRAENRFGHIVELIPRNNDHAAQRFGWEILVRCGDPNDSSADAMWNSRTSRNGWFASPDNACVDRDGNLWVATDQGKHWGETGTADGLWRINTTGEGRGTGRMFFRAPIGSELCSPQFTPDARTLFVAVQHPGGDGAESFAEFGRKSRFNDPVTRWPDFDEAMPPRPSVVAITADDDGVIGG